MNCILIGYGEIGQGVHDYYSQYHKINIHDIDKGYNSVKEGYDIMLVAIPYSDSFIEIIKEYKEAFKPKNILIFSTVPIGTSFKVNAIHSPVEGKHPYLKESISKWQVFQGGENPNVSKFFIEANKKPIVLGKQEHTEFLKLQSTTNYGLMIEYARYINSICSDIGMNYNDVKKFNLAYNELYKELKVDNYKRYILDPPNGIKGGHCVTPNAKLLYKQYPSPLVKEVAEL